MSGTFVVLTISLQKLHDVSLKKIVNSVCKVKLIGAIKQGSCLKQGKDLKAPVAHPYPKYPSVPPGEGGGGA